MPTKKIKIIIVLLATSIPALSIKAGDIWSSLTTSQQNKIISGGAVVVEKPNGDSAWPEYIIYEKTKVSPQKVASTFWGFENSPKYIPNCIYAKNTKVEPLLKDTVYHLSMPMWLPDDVYTSNQSININPTIQTNNYNISWKVTSSKYINSCTGSLKVEEISPTSTLVRYSNKINPGSKIAGILQSFAKKQAIQTVDAIISQSEK